MHLLGTLLLGVALTAGGGERIDEIRWLSAQEAFAKSAQEDSRWVLVYKEWPL